MRKALIAGIALFFCTAAYAEGAPEYTLILKDHKFTPETLEVPANTKIKLLVKNEDKTPAEFESDDFKREKIIGGGKKATIYVGPLTPGEYKFFDEFNEATAQGVLVVKE